MLGSGPIKELYDSALILFELPNCAHALLRQNHFIWHEYCDWYLEMAKLTLWSDDEEALSHSRGTLLATLEGSLKALHPIMPFITEEIWSRLPGDRDLICLSPWPQIYPIWKDEAAERRVAELQTVATELRRLRPEFGIGPGQKVPVDLVSADATRRAELEEIADYLAVLAKAEPLRVVAEDDPDEQGIHAPIGDIEAVLRIADVIDIDAERARIRKNLAAVDADLKGAQGKLANDGFVGKAPAEVVEKVRRRAAELASEVERLRQHLEVLDG